MYCYIYSLCLNGYTVVANKGYTNLSTRNCISLSGPSSRINANRTTAAYDKGTQQKSSHSLGRYLIYYDGVVLTTVTFFPASHRTLSTLAVMLQHCANRQLG